jgi:predicted DNA-binding transcriptional regulator AlpA
MKTSTKPQTLAPAGYASDTTLAKHFEVSRATIWRWTSEGKLPQPVKLSPGCTRWKWEEILAAGGASA